MNQPSRIRAVETTPLDIPLREPFGISGGAQVMANNVLLRVELDDGTVGYGEAAPLPPYNGETQAHALHALRDCAAWLPGRDARAWWELGGELVSRATSPAGSARAALEMALLDACAQQDAVPLWRFFGGAGTTLETDMTITTGSVEAAAAAAVAIRQRGIRTIKVKVGGAEDVEHDLARLAAIREAASDGGLIIDANGGLTRQTASALAQGLKARDITPVLLEQWLPKEDLAGHRLLRIETGWKVAADESVVTPEDARRVIAEKAADVINIKFMKAGISAALDVAEVARAHKIGLMIGGNIESILAMTVSACFAAGFGGFRFADLDTPLFLAENPFRGGFKLEGGTISLGATSAGHGVRPT